MLAQERVVGVVKELMMALVVDDPNEKVLMICAQIIHNIAQSGLLRACEGR